MFSSTFSAEVKSEPFPHMLLKDVFEASAYEQIQAFMPSLDKCHELRHRDAIQNGKSTRLQFGFSVQELATLEPEAMVFWVKLIAHLCSKDTTEWVRKKLWMGLQEKHGEKWKTIKLKPQPWLIRDTEGYRITPHPDIPQKAITLQIYLPTGESQINLGTSLYHHHEGTFTEVFRVPFLPNSGYAFPVTERSWHGVEQTPPDAGCRNSLMLIYYGG